MLISVYFIVLAVTFVVSQYQFTENRDIPTYIKQALHHKNKYKPVPHEKKHTISNLTLNEVFSKIRDITGALNQKAKKNGFKVDYKLRII